MRPASWVSRSRQRSSQAWSGVLARRQLRLIRHCIELIMAEPQKDWLAERFEEHRIHLRAVGYRMLGSLSDADDAIQETWLRLNRSDPGTIDNLGGWLTTVIARVCLDILRARKLRGEEPLQTRLPD